MNIKLNKIYFILQENTAMKSVISKLYYGELCPCEKPAPSTERYIKTQKTICSAEQQLLERFPECKELLDEYTGLAKHIKIDDAYNYAL